jgi:hypothetical protein
MAAKRIPIVSPTWMEDEVRFTMQTISDSSKKTHSYTTYPELMLLSFPSVNGRFIRLMTTIGSPASALFCADLIEYAHTGDAQRSARARFLP